MEVASCSQSYRMQLIEYSEDLQRTPELERRQQRYLTHPMNLPCTTTAIVAVQQY